MAALVVLDAGTGGAKCVIFDERGRCLGRHAERWGYHAVPNRDFPFVKEFAFDAEAFWSILTGCVRTALARSGVDPGEVLAVGTTSQREGCLFLDAQGGVLYAGPNLDSRGFSEGLEVLNTLGAERLYQITGHSAPFIFPLARYLWFRKHDARAVAHVLMINDWMTYRLCGVMGAEPSNATESMLFDLVARAWSPEILSAFSIPATILPAVRACGARIGAIHGDAARATGLRQGTPVLVGGADTQCSLLGAGAVAVGDMAAILGTTTPIQLVTGPVTRDPGGTLWAGCHVVPGLHVLESNGGDTGDAYNWLLDLLVPAGGDRYRQAEELARGQREGATLMYAGPRVFDFGKMRTDRPGGILFPFPTMHMRPNAGELLRAFLESIAFAVRGNMEQLRAVTGQWPSRLIVGGGMSRNTLLVELLADVTALPVRQAVEPESAALGVAMLLATGSGLYADLRAAASAMGRHRCQDPDENRVGYYAGKYTKWQELNDALGELTL
jgi:autoinducer 2 (AI-2) kinase